MLASDLSRIDSETKAVEQRIETLEARKLQLRQRLRAVDDELHGAREAQRGALARGDELRGALAQVEGRWRDRVAEAGAEAEAAGRELAVAGRAQRLAVEAEAAALGALEAMRAELLGKAEQFDVHLVQVLMDHVTQEEKRIEQLGQEAEVCVRILEKHKTEIQMLNVMDRPASSVLDSMEHKRLQEVATAAEVALKACASFVRDFGPFLDNAEAQGRLRKLESDHAQVLRKLAPCRDFLGVPKHPRALTPTRAATPTPAGRSTTPTTPRTPVSQGYQASSSLRATEAVKD